MSFFVQIALVHKMVLLVKKEVSSKKAIGILQDLA